MTDVQFDLDTGHEKLLRALRRALLNAHSAGITAAVCFCALALAYDDDDEATVTQICRGLRDEVDRANERAITWRDELN